MKQTMTLSLRTVQMSPLQNEVNDKVYSIRIHLSVSSLILSRLHAEFKVCPNTHNKLNITEPSMI